MKKLGLVFASLVLVAVAWEFAFVAKHTLRPGGLGPKDCLERFTGESKKSELKTWDQGAVLVTWLSHAPDACLSPGFPVISMEGGNNRSWIQVVRIPFGPAEEKRFVDGVKEYLPFYTPASVFWDTPNYGVSFFQFQKVVWEARAYPVEHQDKVVRVLGGVRWGFGHSFGNYSLAVIPPEAVSMEEFLREDLGFLRESYSDYCFETGSME